MYWFEDHKLYVVTTFISENLVRDQIATRSDDHIFVVTEICADIRGLSLLAYCKYGDVAYFSSVNCCDFSHNSCNFYRC